MSDAPKKKKSKARSIIEWSLTIVFGLFFVFAAIAQVDGMIHRDEHYGQTLRFGWGSFVVETDSMEPEYHVGTAIVTHLDDAESVYTSFLSGQNVDVTFYNYDIVSAMPSDYPTHNYRVTTRAVFTHRLFEVRKDETVAYGQGRYLFFAQGINREGYESAANQYQVFTETQLLGVVKANSPVLGWFFRVISSPWGLLIFLLVPASYMVIVSVKDIFKAIKEPEEGAAAPEAPKSGGDLSSLSEEDKKRLKEELLQEMLNKNKGDKE